MAIKRHFRDFSLLDNGIHARCFKSAGIKQIVRGKQDFSLTLIVLSLFKLTLFTDRRPQLTG